MTTMFPASDDVIYEPDRESWLAARSLGIGGSDVSAIIGLNRYSTPRQVWLEKTGRTGNRRRTWAMARGAALEPALLHWFSRETGISYLAGPVMQRNRDRPWMLGSLDGYGADGSVLETKTANWRMADEWDGQVADHAELQAQWYMAVTGLGHAWVIAAIGDDEPIWQRVPRDENLIALLIETCGRFWTDHVLADVEPPAIAGDLGDLKGRLPTPGTAVVADQVADDWARAYLRYRDAERDAAQGKAEAQARLLQALGDGSHLIVAGEVIATRTVTDRDEYTVAAASYARLTVPAPTKRKNWSHT